MTYIKFLVNVVLVVTISSSFRYLSHKFHGKGSGKNKTEKRMKKWNEEASLKHMTSGGLGNML